MVEGRVWEEAEARKRRRRRPSRTTAARWRADGGREEEERKLDECEWHEEGDDDLREYVLGSRAYEVLKDKPILKIQVWVDET